MEQKSHEILKAIREEVSNNSQKTLDYFVNMKTKIEQF